MSIDSAFVRFLHPHTNPPQKPQRQRLSAPTRNPLRRPIGPVSGQTPVDQGPATAPIGREPCQKRCDNIILHREQSVSALIPALDRQHEARRGGDAPLRFLHIPVGNTVPVLSCPVLSCSCGALARFLLHPKKQSTQEFKIPLSAFPLSCANAVSRVFD